MEWTPEQRRAIETRNTNILLSAAAGSGKTTVLVARVLDLIAAGDTTIDRMLIVTFTRAASADMRAKLSRELGARAAAGDEICRRQQLLLERASISTLHGFCADFLRANFESAGIDPAFRVLDAAETRRIRGEALDEALEAAYAAPTPALEALNYGRGPEGVREAAEILLNAMDERPDPGAWLDAVCAVDDAALARWTGELVAAAHRDIDQAVCLLTQALSDCPDNYHESISADLTALRALREIDEYDPLARALADYHPQTPARKKGMAAGEELKKLRSSADSCLKGIQLKKLPLKQSIDDMRALAPQLECLAELALDADQRIAARKAEAAGLSYTDLEHRTLRALGDEETARAMRERYDYVFVDEYQDTSDVQEALIGRMTRGNNLFMVGDVKQSIYRFRQAEPRLFLQKYADYGAGSGGTLLPLTQNFRSREKILAFVNHVFARVMHGDDSEIVYDERARLNPGPDAAGGAVEIHVLERGLQFGEEDDARERKVCEAEARFIGLRIQSLMRAQPQLKYRDFAVLTRTRRNILAPMADVLTAMGIPAYADGSAGFYDSMEITLALSLLKLTANRRSDVELIGVLRSGVAGLSAEELSQVRVYASDVPFVDAAARYAAEQTDETATRLKRLFALLDRWRLKSACAELGALTRTVLEESGFYDAAGALPGGAQRQANLNRLIENAAAYDKNVSGSLTRFLKHTETLRAGGEGDDAHLLGENDDVVRLTTVHKSKGLEYPIVFGARLDRGFGGGRRAAALSVHRRLGLGCLYCDPQLGTRRKTLAQEAIAACTEREDRAEEMRVLYVLLTRARDRLELVGSERNLVNAKRRYQALSDLPDAADSDLDLIMPAFPDPENSDLAAIHFYPADTALNIPDAPPPAPAAETAAATADEALNEALVWQYPDAQEGRRPLKLTVTGLLRQLEGPECVEPLLERPAFLASDAAALTGAERGTAYHRAMQCLELKSLGTLSGAALTAAIGAQLDELTEKRRLTPAQRTALKEGAIARFIASPLGRRLTAAAEVEREWPFNVTMRMSEALSPREAGDLNDAEILVQGTVDCCFDEGGEWVLIDYKTDRETDAEALTARYQKQLKLYALALERITGRRVKEIDLCLLKQGEVIEIGGAGDR